MNKEACPSCNLETKVSDGTTHKYLLSSPGCWEQFGNVIAKEFQDQRYFKMHGVTVDTYALQHPGTKSTQTINSANVHLVSLYQYLKFNKTNLEHIKKLAGKHKAEFTWLKPPKNATEINIGIFKPEDTPEEHEQKVNKWATYVFEQWSDHHHVAKAISEKLYKYT